MIVYTGGTFDLLHRGHLNFLRMCSMLGFVTVGVNTDEFVRSFKPGAPAQHLAARIEALEHCGFVDHVVVNEGGHDSRPVILQVNPQIVAIGTDWANKNYYAQMGFDQQWLDDHGIVLVYLPYTPGICSTMLREAMK